MSSKGREAKRIRSQVDNHRRRQRRLSVPYLWSATHWDGCRKKWENKCVYCEISTGSFHPVIASELSRNNTKQYGPIMLYMQLEKGGDSPRRLAGFGAICPNCGKAGIAITKPITAFMNPPYGREIIHWMRKAYESSLEGAKVVCLVPARTDTKWWHEYAMKGEIVFLRGRLKFEGAKNSAPFPSAVVIFEGEVKHGR